MRPLVSVIMGVYNQKNREMLYDAVDSILRQTYSDFEFIIWDDGSDADGAEILKELENKDEKIILAGREENRGLAFSLNECIKLAKGKYIARMDSDDVSLPKRFEKQVEFLESHSEYGWCGCAANLFDEEGTWGMRVLPEVPNLNDYFRFSPFVHPSVMFRAELFDEQSGYLDSSETLRCEDYEIFLSLTQRGIKGYNLQDVLFCYRETRESYKKRKVVFRMNEAKLRYRNYKKMGVLFPFGWIFVLRPVVACLIPAPLLGLIKRSEGKRKLKVSDKKEGHTWRTETNSKIVSNTTGTV